MSALVGPRDPAQPLLTLLTEAGRVELSGATAANWVAKTANLLAAQGYPGRVGLLLPLHWQTVTLLLGAVTAGATAVVAVEPGELADCDLAFVGQEHAQAALDACDGDVLAVSTAPLGGRLRGLPPMVLDAGAELPGYGDVLGAAVAQPGAVELAGRGVPVPDLDLGPADRVLTTLPPGTPTGLGTGLLAPLRAGAALVLAPGRPDPAAVAAERVTASVGVDVAGARRLG